MSALKHFEQASQKRSRSLPEDTQQVCVDLPGEEIRCVVHKPKLEIMLRKHRDVIFEIRLFKGMLYTVEADQSDFYNARDKKIVLKARKQTVRFVDGERLHLWIGREFKGKLILKANGKVMGAYQPGSVDRQRYDLEPSTKPAPMIVLMENEPQKPSPLVATSTLPPLWSVPPGELLLDTYAFTSAIPSLPHRSPQDESMHVVEAKPDVGTMPEVVADFFKKGGEDTAIDGDKLLTRNWLWAQIAGGMAYAGDNLRWVRELWNQKFYLSRVRGRIYIIFRGSPGLRTYITGTRYLADTTKIVAISAGAGTIRGVHKASWEAVKGSVKGAAKFAVVLTIALDFSEWLADYEERDPRTGKPKRDFYDLGAKIFTDVAWAVLGAAIGSVLMAVGLTAASAVAGLAVTGGVVIVGSIAAAIIVGYGLAYLDAKLDITKNIAEKARTAGRYLDERLPRDYTEYGQSIENMLLGGTP